MPAPRLSRAAAGLLPLSVVTALVLTGCSSDDAPPPDPDRGCAPTSSAQAEDVRPIDLPPAHVTVTDPGTGDLSIPAPAPRTDAPQRVTLTTESRETSVVGSESTAPTTTVEAVTMALTAYAGCTQPDQLEFTFGDVSSPDEALDPALDAFDGATGGVTYRDGMTPTSLRIFPPQDAEAPASRAVEQSLLSALTYAVPIPTAPIGEGARWRVERTVTAATTVEQVMEVTLTARDGDRLTLDVSVDETPTAPIFRIPGSASTLDLSRFNNTGSGTVTVDLATLLPQSGSLELRGARELVGADAERPILQQTAFSLRWEPTAEQS